MAVELLSATVEHFNVGVINPGSFLTISAWIKCPSNTDIRMICGRDGGGGALNSIWQFRVTAGHKLEGIVWNDSDDLVVATGATTIDDGEWHHVMVIFNGTIVQVYVDGLADDGTPPSLPGTLLTNPTIVTGIGTRRGDASQEPFNGQIAELAIYGTALGANDRALLSGSFTHRMPLAVSVAPEAYWALMDKPAGAVFGATDVRDWSLNGHHSTAVVGTPTGEAAPIAVLGAGPLIVQAPAVAVGGPFPHYIRRRQRGGMIGMGV